MSEGGQTHSTLEKFEMTLQLAVDKPFSCVMDVFCKYTLPFQKSILINNIVDLSGKDEREKSVTDVKRKGERGKADVRKNTICRAAKKIIYRLGCTRIWITLKLNGSSEAAKLKFQRMTHRDQFNGTQIVCCESSPRNLCHPKKLIETTSETQLRFE